MPELALAYNGSLAILTLHFNIKEHCIPLRDFIDTSRRTVEIINAFNEEVFSNTLRYEVVVLPPEQGTFKSRLGIFVLACTGVWTALESDIGKSFTKGLTGNEPAFYAEKAGVKIKELISPNVNKNADNQKTERKSAEVVSTILAESTKGFLEKGHKRLISSGISVEKYRNAYIARNEFYMSCYRNTEIRSIGFDDSENFPINRKNFPEYIIEIPPAKERDAENRWEVEIVYIQVTSPNWDRGDRQRHWKAKLSPDRTVTFSIDDEYFWDLINNKNIQTQVRDNLKVQWAYIADGGKRRNIRILRVLEINGRWISAPLNETDIGITLSKLVQTNDSQKDLFDD